MSSPCIVLGGELRSNELSTTHTQALGGPRAVNENGAVKALV